MSTLHGWGGSPRRPRKAGTRNAVVVVDAANAVGVGDPVERYRCCCGGIDVGRGRLLSRVGRRGGIE